MATHAFHTHRVVSALGGPFADASRLVSAAHERVDGSGYHRGLAGSGLDRAARILAAADVAQALSEPRPHRGPLGPVEAADTLRNLVRTGALCPRAVDAVVGGSGPQGRVAYPQGLTEREVEVLRASRGG